MNPNDIPSDNPDVQVVVVTGGGQGVGRAIVERLIADGKAVVVIELHEATIDWMRPLIDARRAIAVLGDAGDDEVATRAAAAAAELGTCTGWVNNAAVFRDAFLHEAGGAAVAELIAANLRPCLAGSAAAIRAFRATSSASGTGTTNYGPSVGGAPGSGPSGPAGGSALGSIVNVSSHQAQRAVSGALPYATAKGAIEALTRALAVDYGPWGIRVNAVALGSIVTPRMASHLAESPEPDRAAFARTMRELHPLGRPGNAAEAADAVAYLLSDRASFISGAVIPVDGGRAAQGPDPEARLPE